MRQILLRAGVLLFALSVLALLVVQAAVPAGCASSAPSARQATPVSNAASNAAPAPPPAEDPRFLPASKAGPVFLPPPQPAPQAQSGNAAPQR